MLILLPFNSERDFSTFFYVWLFLLSTLIEEPISTSFFTGPKGNSEFCFPKTLKMTSRGIKNHCYIAEVFPLHRAHSLASSWSLDILQWSCFPPNRGNIAKTMTSNGKQFTVTLETLTAVACDQRWPDVVAGISARFSKFAFVLFCNITNHLMIGPLEISEFWFPRISNIEILG